MPLAWLSSHFPSLPLLPTSDLYPSCADACVGGLVYVLEPCGPLQWYSPVRRAVSSAAATPQVFTTRGFEAFLPGARTLGCAVCLAPQRFLPVYPHANVGPPTPPAAASPTPVLQPLPCLVSSPPQLPISTPPTSLDECFFFNSLVVRLPCSSIFWQFWLFIVFKLVVIFLLVVQGSK